MIMATELEIRKEQRGMLFELLEAQKASQAENKVLNIMIVRYRTKMMEEDVALVEKNFKSVYPD